MEVVRFEDIRDPYHGVVFPHHHLADCEDALVLFCAAFLGKHDAFWLAEAGIPTIAVDHDGRKLRRMAELYPETTTFLEADIYDAPASLPRADLVTLDCPSDDQEHCAEFIPLWTTLARKRVFINTHPKQRLKVTAGWSLVDRIHRSDFALGCEWSVLVRDA